MTDFMSLMNGIDREFYGFGARWVFIFELRCSFLLTLILLWVVNLALK